jgi:hypothetical protein
MGEIGGQAEEGNEMNYREISLMCKPRGGVAACPHDGLGCTGGNKCWINDPLHRQQALNAETWADFKCAKRERAINPRQQDVPS